MEQTEPGEVVSPEVQSEGAPGNKAALYAKMAAILGELERVPKRGTNSYYGYKYATESDLLDELRPAMARHRVAFFLSIDGAERIDMKGARGGDVTRVYVTATFACGDTGETITVKWWGDGQDAGDKGLYKALTGAVKYLMMKVFLISTGDDPDAEAEGEVQGEQPKAQAGQSGAHAERQAPRQGAASRPAPAAGPARAASPAPPKAASPTQPTDDGRADLLAKFQKLEQEARELKVAEEKIPKLPADADVATIRTKGNELLNVVVAAKGAAKEQARS